MKRLKEVIKLSILGIIINLILVIFKIIIGIFSNSVVIIIDGVNNLTDMLSSIITIIGVKVGSKKPDKEHPYGHGRIEYLASIIISIIVIVVGVESLKESIEKIISPIHVNYKIISIVILIIFAFIKLFYGRYIKKEGKRLNSNSLIISGVDAISDSVISFSIIVSIIINILFNINLEGYLGIIISILILKTAVSLFKETINNLIGNRADEKFIKKLKQKITSYDEVEGAYDLILHNYGPTTTIGTAHIQVRDDLKANEIHKLTREITQELLDKYGIIFTIGIYASNNSKENMKILKDIKEVLKEYQILQMHGFYVDEEKKEVSFDIIFEYHTENEQEKVLEIKQKLHQKYKDYKFIIVIDQNFSD